jgi:hypothetical protein
MQIHIPKVIVRVYDCFEEWGDQRTPYGIRYIDHVIAIAFVLGATWSYYSGGWFVLLEYTALFIFIVLCCLWM